MKSSVGKYLIQICRSQFKKVITIILLLIVMAAFNTILPLFSVEIIDEGLVKKILMWSLHMLFSLSFSKAAQEIEAPAPPTFYSVEKIE